MPPPMNRCQFEHYQRLSAFARRNYIPIGGTRETLCQNISQWSQKTQDQKLIRQAYEELQQQVALDQKEKLRYQEIIGKLQERLDDNEAKDSTSALLQTREEQLAVAEQHIRDMNLLIEQLKHTIEEKDHKVDQQSHEIEQAIKSKQEMQQQIEQYHKDHHEWQEQLRTLHQQLDQNNQAIDDLEAAKTHYQRNLLSEIKQRTRVEDAHIALQAREQEGKRKIELLHKQQTLLQHQYRILSNKYNGLKEEGTTVHELFATHVKEQEDELNKQIGYLSDLKQERDHSGEKAALFERQLIVLKERLEREEEKTETAVETARQLKNKWQSALKEVGIVNELFGRTIKKTNQLQEELNVQHATHTKKMKETSATHEQTVQDLQERIAQLEGVLASKKEEGAVTTHVSQQLRQSKRLLQKMEQQAE